MPVDRGYQPLPISRAEVETFRANLAMSRVLVGEGRPDKEGPAETIALECRGLRLDLVLIEDEDAPQEAYNP